MILYTTRLSKHSSVDLPCIAYRDTYVEANGQKINYKISKRGTVLVPSNEIKTGKVKITVGFNPGIMYYICIAISTITWIFILFNLIRRERINA